MSCGGSAAKRGTKRSSGGMEAEGYSKPASGQLDEHRDRSVVDELDLHRSPEDAALGAQPIGESLVQRLGLLGPRGRDVGRAVAAPRVAVERELADHERLALAERLVHPALAVGED